MTAALAAILPPLLVLGAAGSALAGDRRAAASAAAPGGHSRRRGAARDAVPVGPWPLAAVALVAAALIVEITAGSALGTGLGGLLRQDRFSLFCDIVLLVAALVALSGAATLPAGRAPTALIPATALAGMIAAAAGNALLLWLALAVAAGAPLAVASAGPRRGAGLIPGSWLRALAPRAGGLAAAAAGLAGLGVVGSKGAAGTLAGVLVLAGLGALAAAAVLPSGPAGGAEPGAARLRETILESVVGGLAAAIPVIAVLELLGSPGAAPAWPPYLLGAAAVAMVAGTLLAIAAASPARLCAALAAGQLGWLLAALSGHHQLSAGAATYLLGVYAVVLAGVPLAAGAAWRSPLAAAAGMAGRDPARATALCLGLLSLAGLPPLGGWFGEFAVAAELARGGHMWLFGLGLLQFAVAAGAAFRLAGLVYVSPPSDGAPRAETRTLATASAAGLVLFVVAYGIFANPVHSLAVQGAAALGLR